MRAASQNLWLAIFLPRLATDRLIRSGRAAEGRPFAVYAKEKGAFTLTCVDTNAAALGLRRTMSLADARAIYPNLAAVEAEPSEDARALDFIAAWCERFTPIVIVDALDGLFLDITGCAHLFGGEAALRALIVTRLSAQGFTARAAIAPTPGAAWALARFGSSPPPISGEGVEGRCKSQAAVFLSTPIPSLGAERDLAALPIEALRLDAEAASLLRRLGLNRIGQLYDAPRSCFTARTGARAMLRLDQVLGRAPEALSPRRPPPPIFALRRFLEPLFSVETILVAARDLCGDVVVQLERRGVGTRRSVLHLFGVDGRDRMIEVSFSRPERDAKAMMRLLREKLSVAAENLDAEFGIEAARFDVISLQRSEGATQSLVAGDSARASAESISAVIDVLSARLGAKRVLRAKLKAEHAPERAGGWRAALSSPEKEQGRMICPSDNVPRRPLTLFARPQMVDAMATVPDGPPIRFRWRRVLRAVVRAEGPERISGDWMCAAPARDYYRVEDAHGRRYWLYREGLYGEEAPPRWFVHGLFA